MSTKYDEQIAKAVASLAKAEHDAVPVHPLPLPSVGAMFRELWKNGLEDFRHPVSMEEEENMLLYVFIAGFLHGHQESVCNEQVNVAHVAETMTELKRLRTYAIARGKLTVPVKPLIEVLEPMQTEQRMKGAV
jgi:hypothetical protein